MTTLSDVQGTLQRLFQRLADSAPVAWRHDPLFRGAAIGAGVTFALLLIRLVGPHDPALDRPVTTLGYLPGNGVQTTSGPTIPGVPRPQQGDVPKIAPGHPLGDVTIVPTPDTDRFGTFNPGKHP